MKKIKLISVIIISLLLIININCKKNKVPVATSIELISGGDQTAIIGNILPNLIEVIVKDQDGNPYIGANVSFTTTDGSVPIATVLTNIEGKAATTWTLGETVGTQTLTAIAYEADGTTNLSGSPINISATATADAESIEIFSGNEQSGEIETELADLVVVLVKDINGNAVAGVTINFSITEGSVSSETEITDANGKAGINWTLGSTMGSQTLTVTAYKLDGITELSGSPLTFTATGTAPSSVTDIDGNTYDAVEIGNQVWMAEDIKVTHYADGTEIPNVTTDGNWSNLSSTDKAYCFYNNASNTDYGALYTWAAAMNGAGSSTSNPSGVQGVCPDGWHLPSDSEWTELTNHLGGINVTGGKLKETGTTHWISPNTGATNESGFTALPGGYRFHIIGSFDDLGYYGNWWSTTQETTNAAWYRSMSYNASSIVKANTDKADGYSVRCILD